jgi:hypothetical protein
MSPQFNRAVAGATVVVLAAALQVTSPWHTHSSDASPAHDPSVPSAASVFAAARPAEGNVHDLTY